MPTVRDLLMESKGILCLLIVALVGESTVHAADWTYQNNGAAKWPEQYPACKGSKQSPINIVRCKAVKKDMASFSFVNYNKVPANLTLAMNNTGHSLTVFLLDMDATISGGGLTGTYKAFNVHFHWGKSTTSGSEHEIDGKQYAGELHIVHYNTKYADISAAVTKDDGIAVLGVLLKSGATNTNLEKFMKYAGNITEPKSTINIDAFQLDTLLPTDRSFFRYSGSLTTPMCQQSVTWTVFNKMLEISTAQLNQLRGMKETGNYPLEMNWRPVQPLNGRVVHSSFQVEGCPTSSPSPTSKAAHPTQAFTALLTVIFLALTLVFAR